ncbi:hypothetical protein EJB05_50226, partial [Eragrostis curvula]
MENQKSKRALKKGSSSSSHPLVANPPPLAPELPPYHDRAIVEAAPEIPALDVVLPPPEPTDPALPEFIDVSSDDEASGHSRRRYLPNVITGFHDTSPLPEDRQAIFQSIGPDAPMYAIIPPPKKRSGDILDFRSLDKDIDAAIPSEDEVEDQEVPQPNARDDAPTPSPPAGPPPRKKLKKDATEKATSSGKKTRASSRPAAPRPRSLEDHLNIVISTLRPVTDISSIERAPETNPSAATGSTNPSSSEVIPEKVIEPEEGAIEDLGNGLGDNNSEDRLLTPPSKEVESTGLPESAAASTRATERQAEEVARVEAEAPKTNLGEVEGQDIIAGITDDSVNLEKTADTERNTSLLAANPSTGERPGVEEENSQQPNKDALCNQELPHPMEVDHRVPEGEAVVASAEAGIISPVILPESETQNARDSSSHAGNSSELQKLLSDLDEDIRKQKQSESINQAKFHYHHGGLLVSFQEMEKNLAAKEKMLLDLRPHQDRQLAMEEQIAALQAKSREKDALIQKLSSAPEEPDSDLGGLSHSAKEERFYQELSKAVDAETAATKVAQEKDQSLKVALEQISNLRTKFSRKKTQLKEKKQLIAGLEAALKTKEDELSANTLELSAAEVIDYVYPSVELKDEKSSSELLEMMPAELKKHCRFITDMCSSAVLAKVKSHYLGLEESRLLTGYACKRPEALALINEVKATATEMVADLNVDP